MIRNADIEAILIDFGGVLAEEGFREGLYAIADRSGADRNRFFADAERIIGDTGYLTGRGDEASFWGALRTQTGISGTDRELRNEILTRFVVREEMLSIMDRLRSRGIVVAVLSDQTNWLEEIDSTSRLFSRFDAVFNSYRTGKSKQDATVFTDACASLRTDPHRTLFIDDNAGHIGRARSAGLCVILFTTVEAFRRDLEKIVGPLS